MRRAVALALLAFALVPAAAVAQDSRRDRSAAQGDLGRAYLAEGSLESAVQALQAACDLDRRNWLARSYLGLALAEKGKPEEAERHLARAARQAPDQAEARLNYGLFLYGQARLDEAIAEYEAALEDVTYRKPAIVLNNLGYALIARGDHARAARVLEEAVQRAPNLCPARFNLGLALERAGDAAGAIDAFKGVVEACGDQAPGAYLQAGRLLAAEGRDGEATALLLRVGELAPGTDAAAEADRLLGAMEP